MTATTTAIPARGQLTAQGRRLHAAALEAQAAMPAPGRPMTATERERWDAAFRALLGASAGLLKRIVARHLGPDCRDRLRWDETRSVAEAALLDALRCWQPERGAFSAPLDRWVRQRLALADRARPLIHVPEHARVAGVRPPAVVSIHLPDDDGGTLSLAAPERGEPCPGDFRPDRLPAPVANALGRLPERHRGVLLARVVDGRPVRDVAADHGLTERTTSNVTSLALRRLRVACGATTTTPTGDGRR